MFYCLFAFLFCRQKGFNQTKKMRFRHVLSPFSSCFWLRQKPQAFQSAENFFSFGCKRKIAFSRTIYRSAEKNTRICRIYAIILYLYRINIQKKDLKSPFSLILEIREFRKNCLFDSLKSSKTYKCKSLQTLHPYLKYSFCNCVLISLRANKICCSTVRLSLIHI